MTNITVKESENINNKSRFKLGTILGIILLLASLSFNALLSWRVFRLNETIDKLKLEDQLVIGAQAPSIKARSLDGRESLIEFQADGRPTLLYFFSPGCETCERNVTNIKMVAEKKTGEYRIIGFSLSEDGLARYVKEKDFNFPIYSGLGVESTLAYKLGRVPQTTIISSDGKVIANWHGPYNGREKSSIESHLGLSFPP